MAWVACERCARGTLEASCIATSPLWVKPMAPAANRPCRVEWKGLRMRDSTAGITASRMSMASGCGCAGSPAPEDGGGALLAGAGAAPGPMMLLMTWSAAFCAAAAGKYTLMVTQPASNASVVARANMDLRIMDLPITKSGVIAKANPVEVYIASGKARFPVCVRWRLTRGGAVPASFDHRRVALADRLQAADQRHPIHRALVPDHGDLRQAAAFHDRVARAIRVRVGRNAAHAAHAVRQRAAQADPRITERLEQPQRHALQSAGDAATADFGEAFDGVLADLAAAVRGQVGIEGNRLPVDKFESVDVPVHPSGDLPETEHASELGQVELVHVDVGRKFRRLAERVLHAQVGDAHRTAESVERQAATEHQIVAAINQIRDSAAELAAERGPAERRAQLVYIDVTDRECRGEALRLCFIRPPFEPSDLKGAAKQSHADRCAQAQGAASVLQAEIGGAEIEPVKG